jgi:hypothetical protein
MVGCNGCYGGNVSNSYNLAKPMNIENSLLKYLIKSEDNKYLSNANMTKPPVFGSRDITDKFDYKVKPLSFSQDSTQYLGNFNFDYKPVPTGRKGTSIFYGV